MFRCFKVQHPEDPFSKSFVRQIIQEDMLRKLEIAVESLSKGIVLTKNIPSKRHDLPTVEACVLEVDVVYEGDRFRATIKVKNCIRICYSNHIKQIRTQKCK